MSATAAFVTLGSEVSEGSTQAVDERLFRSLRDSQDPVRPGGPLWLAGAARDVTALGSTAVLVILSLSIIGFTLLGGHRRLAALALLAAMGGIFLDEGLKNVYGRERPPPEYHRTAIRSASFPSGHALGAAAVYLSLAAVLSARQQRFGRKMFLLGMAFALTLLVGVTRVYLGVHYPTDILGGWLVGLAWAVVCALMTRANAAPSPPTRR